MLSIIEIRGLAIFLGLLMVVCLAVLQMKSLSDLHELGLTVAAMKQNEEQNVGKRMGNIELGREIYSDTEYDEEDVDKLQTPKQRRRRSMDDIKLERANSTVNKSDQHIYTPSGTGGAVYTRWGRTTCPDDADTELVYSGVSGGSFFNHTGAAVNTLCLPNEPIWGYYTNGQENMAYMYGVEYYDVRLFKMTNAEALLYHNMPCAVCRSRLRTSTFMLPARNRCFDDWYLEYHGYLMSGHYSYVASPDYLCVDQAPEADPAGYRQEDSRRLFRVEAICGSLPCPKYMNGRELTCAICSK